MVDIKQDGDMAGVTRSVGERPSWLEQLSSVEGYCQADYLRLRNLLVQVMEEVKLRRETDIENEDRIRRLVREKHELESKCDSELTKRTNQEQKHAEQIRGVHRQYEEKVRQMQEEKSRQQVCGENIEKETKALRDEVRNLQLQKYSLEKQLHEQSSKLQLQMSTAEKYLSQLSSLEQKFGGVAKQYSLVIGSQGRLDKNVEEAVRLNRHLTYVNHHQKCLVTQYKEEAQSTKHQLLEARVRLESQPAEASQHQKELERKLDQLQRNLNQKTKETESRQKELKQLQDRYETSLSELAESHKLIERHLVVAEKHRTCCEELEAEKQTLQTELTDLNAEFTTRCDQLDEAKETHREAKEEWQTQEERLKGELKEAGRHLEESRADATRLEELNTTWAQKNLQLTKELDEAQSILNREKADAEVQVQVENRQTESQTGEVETVSQGFQVGPTLTVASCQIPEERPVNTDTQTPIVTMETFGCQVHLCCAGWVTSLDGRNAGGADSNKVADGAVSTLEKSQQPRFDDTESSQPLPSESGETNLDLNTKDASLDSNNSNVSDASTQPPISLSSVAALNPIKGCNVTQSYRVDSPVLMFLSQVSSPAMLSSANQPAVLPSVRSCLSSFLYPPRRTSTVFNRFQRSGSSSLHTTLISGRNSFTLDQPVPSSPFYARHLNMPAGIFRFPLRRDTTYTTNILGLKSSAIASEPMKQSPSRNPSFAFSSKAKLTKSLPADTSVLSGKHNVPSTEIDLGKQPCQLGVSSLTSATVLAEDKDCLGKPLPMTSPKLNLSVKLSQSTCNNVLRAERISTCSQMPSKVEILPHQDSQSRPHSGILDRQREGPEEEEPELSPYSRYASQLRQSSQEIHYIPNPSRSPASGTSLRPSLLFMTRSSEQQCQPGASVEMGVTTEPQGTEKQDHNHAEDARTSPLRGILKDIYDSKKRGSKAVRFSVAPCSEVTSSPPKVGSCVDGDTPLFSDTEDEPIELGSRINHIQAILASDKLKTGRKRKRTEPS